jgi:hypothetical protein
MLDARIGGSFLPQFRRQHPDIALLAAAVGPLLKDFFDNLQILGASSATIDGILAPVKTNKQVHPTL